MKNSDSFRRIPHMSITKVRYYKAIRHALENDLPLPEWKEE